MGHSRVGRLPRSKKWNQLFDLLGAEARVPPRPIDLASATLQAIQDDLQRAIQDANTARAVWLLTQLPIAAGTPAYIDALAKLGLDFETSPSLGQLSSSLLAITTKYDKEAGPHSDLAELATIAVAESVTDALGPSLPSLFAASPDDVKKALSQLNTKVQFGKLARSFFARFTKKILSYYLSRELPRHVGAGQSFSNISRYQEFDGDLQTHCYQAAKIVEEFSGGWHSKHQYLGTLTPENANKYLAYSIKKIISELKLGGSD
jgi:hypothetical protein